MKYIAIILVSISIFILAHSAEFKSKITNNDQFLKETSTKPRVAIRKPSKSTIATTKPSKAKAHKAIPKVITKPTNILHCKALDGCEKGKCNVNLSPGQNKPLSCNCSKCLPNWNQVCASKKSCHCEKSCG